MTDSHRRYVQSLLDDAVEPFASSRRTFTEQEIFGGIWALGEEVTPQDEPRLLLAWEAHNGVQRHWRLANHVVANNRLIDLITTAAWDGEQLDAMLERLSEEDGVYYVYYPHDPRIENVNQNTIDLPQREDNVALDPRIAERLDRLAGDLLARWNEAANEARTARQVAHAFGDLGWPGAWQSEAWLYVRAWLLHRADIARVGNDYWIPAASVPHVPSLPRLAVLPVRGETTELQGLPNTHLVDETTAVMTPSRLLPTTYGLPSAGTGQQVQWTVHLRTTHINYGWVPVPSTARSIYPPRQRGEVSTTLLSGRWHETNQRFWCWLDRDQNRLYGADLAALLEWCETGTKLQVTWSADAIILQVVGVQVEVSDEEARLIDVDALAELRGGLGESYRKSVQQILLDHPEGLTVQQILPLLRERQQHAVPRRTVAAVLSAGGFRRSHARWFPATDEAVARRRLRSQLVETLHPMETNEPRSADKPEAALRSSITAISSRLAAITDALKQTNT